MQSSFSWRDGLFSPLCLPRSLKHSPGRCVSTWCSPAAQVYGWWRRWGWSLTPCPRACPGSQLCPPEEPLKRDMKLGVNVLSLCLRWFIGGKVRRQKGIKKRGIIYVFFVYELYLVGKLRGLIRCKIRRIKRWFPAIFCWKGRIHFFYLVYRVLLLPALMTRGRTCV